MYYVLFALVEFAFIIFRKTNINGSINTLLERIYQYLELFVIISA